MAAAMGRPSYCPDGCGARIIWATTTAGKRQALNHQPDPQGSVAAQHTAAGTWLARYAPPGEQLRFPEKRHMPHAATCPERGQPRPRELPAGVTGLGAWRKARAEHNRAQRNKRGRRATPLQQAIEQPGSFRVDPEGRK